MLMGVGEKVTQFFDIALNGYHSINIYRGLLRMNEPLTTLYGTYIAGGFLRDQVIRLDGKYTDIDIFIGVSPENLIKLKKLAAGCTHFGVVALMDTTDRRVEIRVVENIEDNALYRKMLHFMPDVGKDYELSGSFMSLRGMGDVGAEKINLIFSEIDPADGNVAMLEKIWEFPCSLSRVCWQVFYGSEQPILYHPDFEKSVLYAEVVMYPNISPRYQCKILNKFSVTTPQYDLIWDFWSVKQLNYDGSCAIYPTICKPTANKEIKL